MSKTRPKLIKIISQQSFKSRFIISKLRHQSIGFYKIKIIHNRIYLYICVGIVCKKSFCLYRNFSYRYLKKITKILKFNQCFIIT